MLNNRVLVKVSLIGFLFLFLILCIEDSFFEPQSINISNVNMKDLNKCVRIDGKIERQSLKNNNLFLVISDDTSVMSAVIFDINYTLDKNIVYDFNGKISYYNDDLELIISDFKIYSG